MKKIKSFTLVEIIVTLVIGILVIFMAGSLYTSIQRINNTTLNHYEQNREILNLYFILKKEFSQSEFVHKNYNSFVFHHIDLSQSKIEFNDNMVLYVRNEFKDTLKTTCTNFQIKSLLNNETYITYLNFDVKAQNNILPMSFYKEYAANDYINLNINPGGN